MAYAPSIRGPSLGSSFAGRSVSCPPVARARPSRCARGCGLATHAATHGICGPGAGTRDHTDPAVARAVALVPV